MIVYKVVRQDKGFPNYCSVIASSEFRKVYIINEIVIANSGYLFSFKTFEFAKSWALKLQEEMKHNTDISFIILKCEAKEVKRFRRTYILEFEYILYNDTLARQYWYDYKETIRLSRNNNIIINNLPNGTIFSKRIKPLEIMKY